VEEEMKIVAVTNNKGGVGKTFLAVHMSIYFANKGKKVLLIDMDEEQADAIRWVTGYKVKEPEPWKIIQVKENLDVVWVEGKATRINTEKYDIIIVDGRPSVVVGGESTYKADLVIFPVDGRLSIENAKSLLEMVDEVRGIKKKIVVVNRQNTRANISKKQFDLAKLIGAELYPFPIRETVRVQEAEHRGVSLWQVKGTPMRKSFEDFLEYVLREVEK
jgi:chromosome partitioning protein